MYSNCFQMYFLKKLYKNCQYFLEIITQKTLTRTDLSASSGISVLRNPNTVTNLDQICR